MTEYNIYATYDFSYDFSGSDAYLTNTGFSSSIGGDIFTYVINDDISAVSVVVFFDGVGSNASIQCACLDGNNNQIPGTESPIISGPVTKSVYTFSNTVVAGSSLRFRITPVNISQQVNVRFCNATIFTVS